MTYTKNQIENSLWQSLALDYNCSPEDFTTPTKKVTENILIPGRRMYQPEPSAFSLVSNGRSAIINCQKELIPFMEDFLKSEMAEWISGFRGLLKVEKEPIVATLNAFELIINKLFVLRNKLVQLDSLISENNLFFEAMYWGLSVIHEQSPERFGDINLSKMASDINDCSNIDVFWNGIVVEKKEFEMVFFSTGSHYYKMILI